MLATLITLFIYLPFSVKYGKKCFFSMARKGFDSVVQLKFYLFRLQVENSLTFWRLFSKVNHAFFYKQHVLSTQPQCCLLFHELEMLLRCCLIHITIIIPRHILYLIYLCPCLCLGLSMSCLCDLFYIFSLIFIVINHTGSLKEMYLFFCTFSRMSPIIFG